MQALLLITTVFLTYEIICLVQVLLHRLFGHRPLIRLIYSRHTGSHHAIYSENSFEQSIYSRKEASLTHTFVPAAAVIALLLWLLLPMQLSLAAIPTVIVTFIAHVYVHAEYHLEGSWLVRYAWFRKRKELHRIHHIDQSKNFGVLEFYWDRIMSTLEIPKEQGATRP